MDLNLIQRLEEAGAVLPPEAKALLASPQSFKEVVEAKYEEEALSWEDAALCLGFFYGLLSADYVEEFATHWAYPYLLKMEDPSFFRAIKHMTTLLKKRKKVGDPNEDNKFKLADPF